MDWFSSLSIEDQQRLALPYIQLLQQQLAQGNIRFQRLQQSLDQFDDPLPYHECPQISKYVCVQRLNKKVCRNCFQTSPKEKVWRCRSCSVWGCIKCNRDSKKVVRCDGCKYSICERCDDTVLRKDSEQDWKCIGCHVSDKIIAECERRTDQLRKGKITRRQAMFLWSKSALSQKSEDLVYRILGNKLQAWTICAVGIDDEYCEDFPDLDDLEEFFPFLLCPNYSISLKTTEFIKEIVNKIVPEHLGDYWRNDFITHLDDNPNCIGRFTYYANDLLILICENGFGGDFEEKFDLVTETEPEFFQRTFE